MWTELYHIFRHELVTIIYHIVFSKDILLALDTILDLIYGQSSTALIHLMKSTESRVNIIQLIDQVDHSDKT